MCNSFFVIYFDVCMCLVMLAESWESVPSGETTEGLSSYFPSNLCTCKSQTMMLSISLPMILLTNLCRTFHFLQSQQRTHTHSTTGAYVLHNRHVCDIHRDTVHHPLAAKDLSLLKKKREAETSHITFGGCYWYEAGQVTQYYWVLLCPDQVGEARWLIWLTEWRVFKQKLKKFSFAFWGFIFSK